MSTNSEQKLDDDHTERGDIERREYLRTFTPSGIRLASLIHITTLEIYNDTPATVYWNPSTNAFLICENEYIDWSIPRTETALRSLSQMIAFNPNDYGCEKCGCSAEFKDEECVCWCDSCKYGCGKLVKLELVPALSRKRSPFFKAAVPSLLPLPEPLANLTRHLTLGIPDLFEPTPQSPPKSKPKQSEVIMEDEERDEWFGNAEDRANVFRNR